MSLIPYTAMVAEMQGGNHNWSLGYRESPV